MFKLVGVVSGGLWGAAGEGCEPLGELPNPFIIERPGKAYRRR
jgi:hypothetical protein